MYAIRSYYVLTHHIHQFRNFRDLVQLHHPIDNRIQENLVSSCPIEVAILAVSYA